jgi:hypothetical protein
LAITGGTTTFLNFNPANHTLIGGSYHVNGVFTFVGANIATLTADIALTRLRCPCPLFPREGVHQC